jgi:cardiolipin synthase (CMP-forming)
MAMPTIPMALTYARIAAIPLLVALLLLPGAYWRYVACAVYAAAAITDYLDGYLARAWKQQSKLGRIFDPIADKLLVGSTILMLAADNRIQGWVTIAALVILCREILVSGLREFLAEIRAILPVSRLAKWKTVVQMTALGFLIVGDAPPTAFLQIMLIGEMLLGVAAVFTLVTGWDYLMVGLRHVGDDSLPTKPEKKRPTPAKPAERRTGSAQTAL